ncbi:response regulator [Rhodobacter sp. SGA-6-6]|uniref:response regulator n=1 Tax=Rhodobacter sp. SGA-6-6 TaxID=2710882 RepID=UPI0013EACBB7|nr:response regulator [Rhodobacter sp. SGA-6-6]NGM46395.1 response regulator [Rhodobacter sp. SGA-6-6]
METPRDEPDAGGALAGLRVLVVEDDFLLAEDVCECLRSEGAGIVGPAGTVEQAVTLAWADEDLDCAVLDLNLRGKPVDDILRILAAKSVPFFFITGYQAGGISEEFAAVPRLVKPFHPRQLVDMIQRQVETSEGGRQDERE